METPAVNPAHVVDAPFYSTEYGEFLSSKVARLAEILHDYNRFLEVRFIPSSKRDDTDTHPFAIWDMSPWRLGLDGQGYVVRHLSEREIEDTQAVLEWLFEADLSKHGVSDVMARAKAKEAAAELTRLKREQDIAAERQELAAAILSGGRDHKHEFRHGGKIFSDKGARRVSETIH